MFNIGEFYILNEKVSKGLPDHVGEAVEIVRKIKSPNYDYEVDLGDSINPVKESELNKLTDKQKQLITYVYKGNRVNFKRANEIVTITKVDFLHNHVEIKFDDNSHIVTEIENIRKLETASVFEELNSD